VKHTHGSIAALVALVLASCGDEGSSSSPGGGGATASATGASTASSSGTGSGGGTASSASVGTASTGSGGASGDLCARCAAAAETGTVALADIDEVSGVVASRLHRDVYFVHDDSGESARIFAVGGDGADRGVFTVNGAGAEDWEDMSAAPCGDGSEACLLIADVGDNDEVRDGYALYRVREPTAVGAGATATLEAEAFAFTYEDGPHDVEAVAVHPLTGVITLVTKDQTAGIYEITPPLLDGAVARRVGERALPSGIPLATGADIDRAGARLAIRTYADVLLFPIAAGATAAQAIAGEPCSAPILAEMQGEAVAWLADGSGFVTIPEGAGAAVHVTRCE
jgi:hypothetical protein